MFKVFVMYITAVATAAPTLWPMPSVIQQSGNTRVGIDPAALTLACAQGATCSPLVQRAMARYLNLSLPAGRSPQPSSAALDISVDYVTEEDLQDGVQENYSLAIVQVPAHAPSDKSRWKATLRAHNEWGALRALETMSQLLVWSPAASGSGSYHIDGPPLYISDAPRFGTRALMLDTGRNFIDVPTILRTLDAMGQNKLNMLVWHLTDDGAFPLRLLSHPELAQHGALGPQATYSPDDVRRVVAYARDRGVRVVPELDVPGHALAWKGGAPDLFPQCPNVSPGSANTLDPSNERVYTVVQDIMLELEGVFPDKVWSIEGDEVPCDCWMQDAALVAWAAQQVSVTQ
jgi:hexosaminidase